MIFSNNNNQTFKVAIYIRLSRDDGDRGESESIGNQRDIIMRYIKENNLQFIDEYVDDGISGTTFERVGFQRMIADIEKKRINMVITKDLSRLGREYIQTGQYIEKFFPEHNVRYVAINDGIDTFKDSSCNDITPFKSILNDMYAKDISKKVRSVIKEKQIKGEYMCTVAPYGYQKDKLQKNHLVIDENTSYIVKDIFNMYLNGNSVYGVRDYLNKKNIQSPSGYEKKQVEIKKWNSVTILNILSNMAYIGTTVSNKRVKLSYKSKKRIKMPKEEYIITENTHEPIISKEDFEKVQFLLDKKSINRKNKHEYMFRGLIKCKTCHSNLEVGAKLTTNGKEIKNPIPYITCRNSKKGICPSQHLNYNKFEKETLAYLKEFLNLYAHKDNLKKVYKDYKNNKNSSISKYQKEIKAIENKITNILSQIESIYFDKINHVISEDDYFRYTNKIISERDSLINQKNEIKKLINDMKQKQNKVSEKEMNKLIDEFLNTTSKKSIYQLIDKIEIDENKNIYIHFAFGKLNCISEYMNEKIKLKELLKEG